MTHKSKYFLKRKSGQRWTPDFVPRSIPFYLVETRTEGTRKGQPSRVSWVTPGWTLRRVDHRKQDKTVLFGVLTSVRHFSPLFVTVNQWNNV